MRSNGKIAEYRYPILVVLPATQTNTLNQSSSQSHHKISQTQYASTSHIFLFVSISDPCFTPMAYLPSLSISCTLHKLEIDSRKLSSSSSSVEKSLSFLRSHDVPLDSSTVVLSPFEASMYIPLLQQCGETKSFFTAEALHGHILKTGAHADLLVSTSLVNTYMKCGASAHAHKLFDVIPQTNIVTWTTLISGYVRNNQAEEAVGLFIQLRESGFYPTNFTLGPVFNACSSLYSLELGKQLHGYIIKYHLESDTSLGNSLCSLYAKCRSLDLAVKAFQTISNKNVISWTTIISSCGDNGNAELGLRIFHEMLLEDVLPNEFTLTSALSLCTETQSFGLGKQVHAFCVKYGCDSSVPMKNSIMYFYLKSGENEEAMRLFNGMETVSLITWNALIAGHAQLINNGKDGTSAQKSGMAALNMFQMLHESSMKPDHFTFSSVLSVCSDLVALEQGEQVHAQAMKSGFLSDVVVNSALVTMYNKCGCIEKAAKAFVEMSTRTLVSWTSMITAYSQHGRSTEALQLFEDMRMTGVRPNKITFVGVLSACSHAGLVKEAEHYFKMMRKEYKLEPVIDHYACMVDMFVRLGQMEEAFMFVERVGFDPNEIIWSILIAGCRTHGNMELCYYAAERLLEQRPKEIETYVLLLNMYLSAGRWQDVSKVRKMMKEEKIGSIRDRSWINIRDKVYYFRADDRSYSRTSEMYEFLENLIDKAREMGYVPYKDVCVSEAGEEKISSSAVHHSERLAVAFGLLNLTKEAPVRVVKNISMCRDCHSAVKYFSILTKREIVVRDSKRLHRFRDGRCCCGDFAH